TDECAALGLRGAIGLSALSSDVCRSMSRLARPSRISTLPDGDKLIRTPPCSPSSASRYCQSGMRYSSVTSTHAALASWMLDQLVHGFFLQPEKLPSVIEIRGLVLGEEVGRDGTDVLLQRKNRQSHSGTGVQHCRLDVVGTELGTAFDLLKDGPLHVIAAQGQRLRLGHADNAEGQRCLCLLAQTIERQTPLDRGLAQTG